MGPVNLPLQVPQLGASRPRPPTLSCSQVLLHGKQARGGCGSWRQGGSVRVVTEGPTRVAESSGVGGREMICGEAWAARVDASAKRCRSELHVQ